MMYLIRTFCLLILVFIFSGCRNQLSVEEYDELCPYERQWDEWAFYLEIPLIIEPHKQTYQVGDTMNIKIEVTDDIYDLNRQRSFKIEDFPLKPGFELYRVNADGWVTGYIGNEVKMDSIYNPHFSGTTSRWSNTLFSLATYEKDLYFLEWELILKEPGRYVHLVRDNTETIDLLNDDLPEYAAIKNDAGCPVPHDYIVSYVLQGDPRFEEFERELQYVDEVVKLDKMCSLNGNPSDFWAGGLCRITAEFSGVFGFEVVE